MTIPQLPRDIHQIILQFLPIGDIYSRATLLNKDWHSTTETLLTWKTVARLNWPSMNEFLTRLETADKRVIRENENEDDEEVEKKKTKASGKRTKRSIKQSKTKRSKTEVTKPDIHQKEYWKKLVINRFERDNSYAIRLLNATREFMKSGTEERSTSEIELAFNQMKLLVEVYDINLTKSDVVNKYIAFMHDSIIYNFIQKDSTHDNRGERHDIFNVSATFLDHLFREHSVRMNYHNIICPFGGDGEPILAFQIGFNYTFYFLACNDTSAFAANKETEKRLFSLLQIDEDDPEKPSTSQIESFLEQFCFFDNGLEEYRFFDAS